MASKTNNLPEHIYRRIIEERKTGRPSIYDPVAQRRAVQRYQKEQEAEYARKEAEVARQEEEAEGAYWRRVSREQKIQEAGERAGSWVELNPDGTVASQIGETAISPEEAKARGYIWGTVVLKDGQFYAVAMPNAPTMREYYAAIETKAQRGEYRKPETYRQVREEIARGRAELGTLQAPLWSQSSAKDLQEINKMRHEITAEYHKAAHAYLDERRNIPSETQPRRVRHGHEEIRGLAGVSDRATIQFQQEQVWQRKLLEDGYRKASIGGGIAPTTQIKSQYIRTGGFITPSKQAETVAEFEARWEPLIKEKAWGPAPYDVTREFTGTETQYKQYQKEIKKLEEQSRNVLFGIPAKYEAANVRLAKYTTQALPSIRDLEKELRKDKKAIETASTYRRMFGLPPGRYKWERGLAEFQRGAISGIREEPLKAAATYGGMTAISFFTPSAGVVSAKIVGKAATKVGGRVLTAGLLGTYGAGTAKEIYTTPRAERAALAGRKATTEWLPMYAGVVSGARIRPFRERVTVKRPELPEVTETITYSGIGKTPLITRTVKKGEFELPKGKKGTAFATGKIDEVDFAKFIKLEKKQLDILYARESLLSKPSGIMGPTPQKALPSITTRDITAWKPGELATREPISMRVVKPRGFKAEFLTSPLVTERLPGRLYSYRLTGRTVQVGGVPKHFYTFVKAASPKLIRAGGKTVTIHPFRTKVSGMSINEYYALQARKAATRLLKEAEAIKLDLSKEGKRWYLEERRPSLTIEDLYARRTAEDIRREFTYGGVTKLTSGDLLTPLRERVPTKAKAKRPYAEPLTVTKELQSLFDLRETKVGELVPQRESVIAKARKKRPYAEPEEPTTLRELERVLKIKSLEKRVREGRERKRGVAVVGVPSRTAIPSMIRQTMPRDFTRSGIGTRRRTEEREVIGRAATYSRRDQVIVPSLSVMTASQIPVPKEYRGMVQQPQPQPMPKITPPRRRTTIDTRARIPKSMPVTGAMPRLRERPAKRKVKIKKKREYPWTVINPIPPVGKMMRGGLKIL